MKTVWIKHNHLQELLPIQEWRSITIEDGGTHVIHYYGKNVIGIEHPLHKENFSNGYLFYEYIGDQRGDGWFYVADGDLPPFEPNAVLCHDGHGLLLMMPEDLHKKDAWNHRNKAKC